MNLVKVEFEHNNIKSYIKKSLIICFATLFIMLFIFFDEEIYKNISELLENWPSMIYIVSLIALFSYTILAAVMHSKFVVSEYSGKRAILLFSYPIKRSKILYTKCSIIWVFTILSVLFTYALIFGLFVSVSIGTNPGEEIIYMEHIVYMMQMLSISVIFSAVIGIVSGYLGLTSHSVQTTIVSAVILCVIATQIIGYIYSGDYNASDYTNLVIIVDAVMITIGIIVYKMLEHKIKIMELE